MQAQDWLRLGYLLVVLLVPLVPAYLLYKVLPSDANVSGPFKGLTIKLTGAFGGYFILVLVCFSFAYFVLTPAKPTYEVWEVTGVLKASDKDLAVGTSLTLQPPEFRIASSGKFTATVTVKPGHVEGQRIFPQLHFSRQGHETVVLFVNEQIAKIDERTKQVQFSEPIDLKVLPSSPTKPIWGRGR
ncbi:MAG: hypothetical protein AMJ94_13660 [Deltaproteobacteria bacterium SM23_61]|nr:MAG: hypothetical protein AMJ94_13660 [Deltaproteobacteria bacterium SM23_61]